MSSKLLMTFSRGFQWRQQMKMTRSTKLDFIPKAGNPDTFGTLRDDQAWRKVEEMPEEKGDREEVEYIDNIEGKTRLQPVEYAKLIKQQLNSKDLVSAIDIMETRMLQKEIAKPDKYIYKLLISGCAKFGYTKKAFQLFNQMKKRGIAVSSSIYTSLFNACANDPWPKDGLQRALHLKDLMKQKGYQINNINANAMIKAFGRCGDIEMAFRVVDEMKQNRLNITTGTINFLLQACVSDTKSGLRYALIVWRKLIEMKLRPNLYTYNLLLKCTRECELGYPDLIITALKEYLPDDKMKLLRINKTQELNLIQSSVDGTDDLNSLVPFIEPNKFETNLLAIEPQISGVIYLDKIEKKWHKLMLFGGSKGFLDIMAHSKINPDIKTFTQLLLLMHGSREEEEFLIKEMKNHNVKMDIDFCNMLIKKRNRRYQFADGKDVLKIITNENLVPNTITFGVLALGCKRLSDSKRLLSDMKKIGIPVNIEILGSLVHCGCKLRNIKMIIYPIKILMKEKIKPNNIFMKHLNSFNVEIQGQIKKKESGCEVITELKNEEFLKDYKNFITIFNQLSSLEIEDPENIHPWKQFKEKSELPP